MNLVPQSIAIVSNSALSITNFRGPLIEELISQGTEVYALAPDYSGASRKQVEALGARPIDISLDRASISPLRAIADLYRLTRTLRKLAPDAVLSYFLKPVVLGTWAAVMAGVRRRYVLVEGLGYIFGQQGERNFALAQRVFASALARASAVMLLNDEDRALLVDRRLIQPSNAQVIGGIGVDLDHFAPAASVLEPVTYILVARLLREKGIEDFAAAARVVRAAYPTTRFVLLGGADPSPIALPVAEVIQWVAEGLIEWHGQVDDVRPYLAAASVFVLPSYYREGVPRSSQEAMALARPIITTDNVGCRETVIDGVNGFLVSKRDPSALANAMIRFVEERSLISTMGIASRALAEKLFDCRVANARILAIINRC